MVTIRTCEVEERLYCIVVELYNKFGASLGTSADFMAGERGGDFQGETKAIRTKPNKPVISQNDL